MDGIRAKKGRKVWRQWLPVISAFHIDDDSGLKLGSLWNNNPIWTIDVHLPNMVFIHHAIFKERMNMSIAIDAI